MLTSEHAAARWLAADLAARGMRHAVISPGSRNAPLVLALHHHPEIAVAVAVDERAAAHMALGMALRSGTPAAVVSTSGTAAVNFGPAIAEAFHQRVPLLALTADRPAGSIGRGHGQTVFQAGLFAAHTVFSATLDATELEESALRACIADAWEAATAHRGPVHLNVPFDEPLYGTVDAPCLAQAVAGPPAPLAKQGGTPAAIPPSDRVLLLLGPAPHARRIPVPEAWSERWEVLADAFSGWVGAEASADRWLRRRGGWQPDVVVTVGGAPMSKALRHALSACPRHVHVGEGGWDVWGRMEAVTGPDALGWLGEQAAGSAASPAGGARPRFAVGGEGPLSDAVAFSAVAQATPAAASVHVANSTAARYAQLVDWPARRVHANRGVAGIDGCTATAVGEALAHPGDPVLLVSGDLAFLYDLNGLWVDPEPANLRVVVVDNGGGAIFRWLKGPADSGLLERYFEGGACRTDRAGGRRSLEWAARSVGAACRVVARTEELGAGLHWLWDSGTPAVVRVLVVETDAAASERDLEYLMGTHE